MVCFYFLIKKIKISGTSSYHQMILPSFITGSYDRTCKLWDTASGEELHTLDGHRNVVYAIGFNNPYGDKIATGSFDKTCKLWSTESGKCFHTYRGHNAEIVCLAFNPQSTLIVTGSMDNSAKLWDVATGNEICTFMVWSLRSSPHGMTYWLAMIFLFVLLKIRDTVLRSYQLVSIHEAIKY